MVEKLEEIKKSKEQDSLEFQIKLLNQLSLKLKVPAEKIRSWESTTAFFFYQGEILQSGNLLRKKDRVNLVSWSEASELSELDKEYLKTTAESLSDLGTSAKKVEEDRHWFTPSTKLLVLTTQTGEFAIIEGKLLEKFNKP